MMIVGVITTSVGGTTKRVGSGVPGGAGREQEAERGGGSIPRHRLRRRRPDLVPNPQSAIRNPQSSYGQPRP
ncbi:MAG: hypothetical protein U0841_06175 [Chloroflexia bacterium]